LLNASLLLQNQACIKQGKRIKWATKARGTGLSGGPWEGKGKQKKVLKCTFSF